MLITQNFRIARILSTTWKLDVLMVVICVASYVLHEFVIPNSIEIPATLSTLLGTAIAFFVGFNNNQAYDRWWEARTIWGALVNDSRSWTRTVLHNLPAASAHPGLKQIQTEMVRRQLAFVYALKANLRRRDEKYYHNFLSEDEIKAVNKETNISNAILTLNATAVQRLSDEDGIDGFRFLQLNQLLASFTDHMGKCERIRNTVFPTSYVFYTRLFIFILSILITLNLSASIGPWSVLIGWLFGVIFHITHQNGMYLMDPFEEVATGIPLNQISRTIEINLLEMLGEKDIPPAEQPINNEYFL